MTHLLSFGWRSLSPRSFSKNTFSKSFFLLYLVLNKSLCVFLKNFENILKRFLHKLIAANAGPFFINQYRIKMPGVFYVRTIGTRQSQRQPFQFFVINFYFHSFLRFQYNHQYFEQFKDQCNILSTQNFIQLTLYLLNIY